MIKNLFLLQLLCIAVAASMSIALAGWFRYPDMEVLAQISPYREFILGATRLTEKTILSWALLLLSVVFAFPYSSAAEPSFDNRIRFVIYSLAFFALTISPFFYIVSDHPKGGYPAGRSNFLRDIRQHFILFSVIFAAHSIVLSLAASFLMSSIRNILKLSGKSK